MMTDIILARVYEHEIPVGYHILVDRLWPRGKSRAEVQIDKWAKEISPSLDLRKWFAHDDDKFLIFKQRYCQELDENPNTKKFLILVKKQLLEQDVVFLYGSRNTKHNQAIVLKDYIEQRL